MVTGILTLCRYWSAYPFMVLHFGNNSCHGSTVQRRNLPKKNKLNLKVGSYSLYPMYAYISIYEYIGTFLSLKIASISIYIQTHLVSLCFNVQFIKEWPTHLHITRLCLEKCVLFQCTH